MSSNSNAATPLPALRPSQRTCFQTGDGLICPHCGVRGGPVLGECVYCRGRIEGEAPWGEVTALLQRGLKP